MAKILVADDNPMNREFMVALLGYDGHSLYEAADGAEALSVVSAEHPDLIITDALMPTMDGRELVHRLRSTPEAASTPVIFCTAHFRERDAQDLARKCGVEHILTIPCDLRTILQTVDASLGKAAIARPPTIPEAFDREHLRLVTDRLSKVNLRLEALVQISLHLSSESESGRLLEEFCRSARDLCGAKRAIVVIESDDSSELPQLYLSGFDLDAHPIVSNTRVVYEALWALIKGRQSVRVRNSEGDPRILGFPADYPRFESLLAAPIGSLSRRYGWLLLLDRLGAPEFDEEDEGLASILGTLVGQIYENGRMYETARRQAADLAQEVADRKRAEEALRNSEVRYRLFFEKNPVPGWVHDQASLRFLDVNEAAVQQYGFTREEFLSMTINDLLVPADQPAAGAAGSQTTSGEIHRIQRLHRKKDGSVINVERVSHSLVGPEPGEFVLAHDITERVQRERVEREAAERLDFALKASRTGVWSWYPKYDKVVWDAYTDTMFGLARGAFRGAFADMLAAIHPEDRDLLAKLPQRMTQGELDVNIEFRVIWPDASVHHLASRGQASYDEAGILARVTGLFQDITEHKVLEEQFRQAQKMEAVGQLAAGLAHDFNNVLTIIIGYCSLLLTNLNPPETVRQRLEEIQGAGERAASLTQQLLAFSRKQVLQPRVVNLGSALEDVDRLFRRVLGEDIEIVTVIDPDLHPVKIDPNQFQQAIMNLVVNARDAMPQGGKLTLELKNQYINGTFGHNHHGVPPGRYVMLAVSDNGIGMKPEVRDRVFEPFFTTKPPGQGSGLGLATVYGIVQQSGGHIWLYSEPGIGTTFRIFLPRVHESPETLPDPVVSRMVVGDETILLVEDESEVRDVVREILESVGYTVLDCESGEDAFRASAQYQGTIDLLISDVVLQKTGGRNVAEQITAQRPETKVLFISGYTGDAIVHHGILDPNADFLQKPFTSESLCAKVRLILDSQRKIQNVLVIDDDPSILTLLTAILEESGFRVVTVSGGLAALETLLKNPIDLVITDLAMPEYEGIELIRGLKKSYPRLKIIAMSGAFTSEVFDAARILGADATISKPLTADALLKCIQSLPISVQRS